MILFLLSLLEPGMAVLFPFKEILNLVAHFQVSAIPAANFGCGTGENGEMLCHQ